ncbi:conserved hypothetical protein [anaerobic digester metagenome]|jgi:hypothetical protein|uniref:Uncharacterized protein n=1 Tax=anaerobic digester metagenome TaxID=1263854 RepID=A0A485M8I6_9ZZZZ|nr:DUF2764 family protein [Deltaproteobacteria bacterium]
MGNYYFLMCLLPALPETLGEKMPMELGDIAGIVKRNIHPEHIEVACALLHGTDVFNWEQVDQGRDIFLEGGLLSRQDLIDGRNLPDYIRVFREERERGIYRPYIYDRLWELYYSYAYSVAQRSECRFLIDYLSWEIELRLSLTAMRIREEGGVLEDHAILDNFRPRDFSNLITQIKNQKDPLGAERYLDEERLRQITRCEGAAPFSIDALLAYVARAAIYSRWEAVTQDFDVETYLWHGGSM